MGMLELGVTFSYGQLVLDNEIASMVKRVVQGSPTDFTTMGVDTIHKVGSGKNFLKEKHTLKFMPSEQSKVKVFDRRTRGSWEKRGATDAGTRANEIARDLLANHQPSIALEEGALSEMKAIIAAAEKEAVSVG
jgi:trimethylamine--corrinoid protein Co-methyltransferase